MDKPTTEKSKQLQTYVPCPASPQSLFMGRSLFFWCVFFFSRFLVTIPVLWSHPRMVLWACMDVTLLPVELETGEKADKNDPFQCFRRDVWTVTG